MRLLVASSALAVAFVLTPVAANYTPALCQDFSITNQVEPASAAHRDVMRQLLAWWDSHAYYPQRASNSGESGTVKVHLVILPDGRIWTADVVGSSGSHSLDAAGAAVFRGGSVRPFPEGTLKADIDLSLHYVLAHRQDEQVAAGATSAVSKDALKDLAAQMQAALKSGDMATAARLSDQLNAGLRSTSGARPAVNANTRLPFTVTNDPVKSPILETMLQRTCTGTMVLAGIPNHPVYGMRSWAQAVFFRKPDGTPWVKFYERGFPSLSPVTEVGKMVTWTGRQETVGAGAQGYIQWFQYTAWSDGDNHLHGAISIVLNRFGVASVSTGGGSSIDLTCAAEALPSVTWNDRLAMGADAVPLAPP